MASTYPSTLVDAIGELCRAADVDCQLRPYRGIRVAAPDGAEEGVGDGVSLDNCVAIVKISYRYVTVSLQGVQPYTRLLTRGSDLRSHVSRALAALIGHRIMRGGSRDSENSR